MTRSEQFRKSRAWLKTHTFVITKSLWSKIEQLPGETQEEYCYVQNKILISTDEWENLVNDNHSSPPLTIRMGQMRWEVLRGLGRFRGRGNEGRAKPDRSGPGP